MRVLFAHLCDYAMVSNDGKPSLIGLFSAVKTRDLPSVHLQSFIALGFDLENEPEPETLEIRLVLVAPSGETALEMTNVIKTGEPIPGSSDHHAYANALIKLPPLALATLGRYWIRVFFGSAQSPIHELSLDVERAD